MSRPRNPIAVAMRRRYGKTTSVYHDKRKERGGNRNESRDLLDELDTDEEACVNATKIEPEPTSD